MNPSFLGDSYDLVKRFFCYELAHLGYKVVTDPMFTGEWNESCDSFLQLIGATSRTEAAPQSAQVALFLDPDTGVNHKDGRQHVSFTRLAIEASKYPLVFSFDQSFSRRENPNDVIKRKLAEFKTRGCHAMYYDSHARFLFVSKQRSVLKDLRAHFISLGLPQSRLPETG